MLSEYSKVTGISKTVILSRSRVSEVVAARHVYWYLLYKSGYTISQIAKLSVRTWQTVQNGIDNINMLLEVNDQLVGNMFEKTKHLITPDMNKIKSIIELHIPQNRDSMKTSFDDEKECENCHGTGYIYFHGWMEKFKTNPDDPDKQACPICQGSGRLKVEVNINWSPCAGKE